MSTRIVMLAYAPEVEVIEMTRDAVRRALETTHEARLTLAINGGPAFSVPAHERLDTVYWANRVGLGTAYNSIVAATTESVLCFLHNDCFVPEGQWIGKLTATAEKHGFAFPAVETDEQEALERGITPAIATLPPSCCYAVSREAWNALGGFDDAYTGCHFEDTDLFMRGIKAGYRMAQVPEVTVFHRRGVTRAMTSAESNMAFRRNKEVYTQRWWNGAEVPLPQMEVVNGY